MSRMPEIQEAYNLTYHPNNCVVEGGRFSVLKGFLDLYAREITLDYLSLLGKVGLGKLANTLVFGEKPFAWDIFSAMR
jgi:hypothetical protein